MDSILLVEQKHLKKAGLIALITVLNMTAPLSTDMYMPSFPTMAEYFGASASVLNLTLIGFSFFSRWACSFLDPGATATAGSPC